MVLLDTDHMSLLERGTPEGARIRERLRSVPPDDAGTTIVSYEEQTRGWMARIAQLRTPERQLTAYAELKRQLRNYCSIAVLDFDARALAEFTGLRRTLPRIGTSQSVGPVARKHVSLPGYFRLPTDITNVPRESTGAGTATRRASRR